jgi:hypothetical protein
MTTSRQSSVKGADGIIHQLFMFNGKFAGKTEETEHLKQLYFFPADIHEGLKQKSVGLSEALVRFTSDFSPNRPCEYMLNQKRKHVFFQPEPQFEFVEQYPILHFQQEHSFQTNQWKTTWNSLH